MPFWIRPSAIGLVLAFALSPAAAQNPPPPAAPQAMTPAVRILSSRLATGLTLDRYLGIWRNEFRQADADMNGVVDQADIDLHAKAAAAAMRMFFLAMFLPADFDGDGVITEEELRFFTRYRQRTNVPAPSGRTVSESMVDIQLRRFKTLDLDGDGRVTVAELLKSGLSGPERQALGSHPATQVRSLLSFVADGKTGVSLADIEPPAEAMFRTVDTDGDNVLSQDEVKAYRLRPDQPDGKARLAAEQAMRQREEARRDAGALRARKEQEAHAACLMPKASDAAQVVLVGGYETQALSTTTVGSQDIAVGVGDVIIEPGEGPLYLVMVSHRSTIWRFTGAVERLERVVLAAAMPQDKPAVGATGVAPERITFLGQSRCVGYFSDSPSTQSSIAAATVRREVGKDVALIVSRYAFSSVAIPSGHLESASRENRGRLVIVKPSGTLRIEGDASNVIVRNGPGNLIEDLHRFRPGGVIEIDPARVVSSLPAERYQVLPQQAGLLQLVQSGALVQNRSGEYLIKEKIRFPAELTGAHSVKFLLLRGVPMPEGNPGHSTVISEETGEALTFGRRG